MHTQIFTITITRDERTLDLTKQLAMSMIESSDAKRTNETDYFVAGLLMVALNTPVTNVNCCTDAVRWIADVGSHVAPGSKRVVRAGQRLYTITCVATIL